MKEYVTGASGFIGKHLTSKLDSPIAIPHQEIKTTSLEQYNNFYFLSAYGNMAQHTEDGKIFKANIEDLLHVVRETDFTDINSFVFISTSSVNLPVQTMYSRTKRAAEEILLSLSEKYHAPILIIRPLSVTGVGEQKEHLIPTLIRSCIDGEEMDFVPEPTHDFVDVEDLVNGILFLRDRNAKGIFELGTGEQYTNERVKEIVELTTGEKANIRKVRSLRNYDTTNWVSRNNRARNMGWMPKKTLEESIEEMVEAYEKTK